MLLALLLMAAGPSGVIVGDFDRDGRPDRIRLEKKGDGHRVVMYRATGEVVPVEQNVPAGDDFKFRKVDRDGRKVACNIASLPRYACDAGDVVQYGSQGQGAMAVWNGDRFVIYRPPSGTPAAAAQ